MALAHSRLTAQRQISVPLAVRKKLGVGPGAILEWNAHGDAVVVRKAGRFSSLDVHTSLFARPPQRRSLGDLKAGLRRYITKRHAPD